MSGGRGLLRAFPRDLTSPWGSPRLSHNKAKQCARRAGPDRPGGRGSPGPDGVSAGTAGRGAGCNPGRAVCTAGLFFRLGAFFPAGRAFPARGGAAGADGRPARTGVPGVRLLGRQSSLALIGTPAGAWRAGLGENRRRKNKKPGKRAFLRAGLFGRARAAGFFAPKHPAVCDGFFAARIRARTRTRRRGGARGGAGGRGRGGANALYRKRLFWPGLSETTLKTIGKNKKTTAKE